MDSNESALFHAVNTNRKTSTADKAEFVVTVLLARTQYNTVVGVSIIRYMLF